MTKYLRVTMPDGSKFDVPAELIAKNRAAFYAKNDTKTESGEEYERVYTEEYEYTLSDKFELKDWAANNMNWDEVESHAEIVWPHPEDVDFQEGWVNGPKEIVEKTTIEGR